MNLHQLETLLGPDRVQPPEQNSNYRPAGWPLLPVVFPHSIEELSALMRKANDERWAVIPAGGGTKLSIGNLPARADLIVSTGRMNGVQEHQAADLTATALAGCTLQTFQDTIKKHGQYLPVEAPYCERATIGGIVAAASYGSLRVSSGAMRDWLIGIKVVNADGSVTKAGGKVVKNVAGYDLMKLYNGSYGTLAVIAEMNFKLRPRPATEATLLANFDQAETLFAAARALLGSQLQPAALDMMGARALALCFPAVKFSAPANILAARFLGGKEAVDHQCARLPALWPAAAEIAVVDTESSAGWRRNTDLPLHYRHDLAVRVSVLPSQLSAALALVNAHFEPLVDEKEVIAQVGIASARILATCKNAAGDLSRWQQAVKALRAFCARNGGSTVIEQAPLELQRAIDAWGGSPAAHIMQAIKRKLDPNNILNPGRFVAGI